jgi:hypothetical protein
MRRSNVLSLSRQLVFRAFVVGINLFSPGLEVSGLLDVVGGFRQNRLDVHDAGNGAVDLTWARFHKTFYGRNLLTFVISLSVCQTRLEKLTNDKHSSLL